MEKVLNQRTNFFWPGPKFVLGVKGNNEPSGWFPMSMDWFIYDPVTHSLEDPISTETWDVEDEDHGPNPRFSRHKDTLVYTEYLVSFAFGGTAAQPFKFDSRRIVRDANGDWSNDDNTTETLIDPLQLALVEYADVNTSTDAVMYGATDGRYEYYWVDEDTKTEYRYGLWFELTSGFPGISEQGQVHPYILSRNIDTEFNWTIEYTFSQYLDGNNVRNADEENWPGWYSSSALQANPTGLFIRSFQFKEAGTAILARESIWFYHWANKNLKRVYHNEMPGLPSVGHNFIVALLSDPTGSSCGYALSQKSTFRTPSPYFKFYGGPFEDVKDIEGRTVRQGGMENVEELFTLGRDDIWPTLSPSGWIEDDLPKIWVISPGHNVDITGTYQDDTIYGIFIQGFESGGTYWPFVLFRWSRSEGLVLVHRYDLSEGANESLARGRWLYTAHNGQWIVLGWNGLTWPSSSIGMPITIDMLSDPDENGKNTSIQQFDTAFGAENIDKTKFYRVDYWGEE